VGIFPIAIAAVRMGLPQSIIWVFQANTGASIICISPGFCTSLGCTGVRHHLSFPGFSFFKKSFGKPPFNPAPGDISAGVRCVLDRVFYPGDYIPGWFHLPAIYLW
jgi:hypothetical protein